ncbi:hypothetical protein [Neobacillus sp. DY30]|uniref:CDI toxin immunity protein n=1 Tax=Neobacillus sp. DY30 TaxID=3047871 RepID=UPI0024BF8732|nr:hypothetical protein [Neobacillus sp. DY30]WHX98008.1 hypothetical protein QNH29_15110 [Neobacillus sp. DY30]
MKVDILADRESGAITRNMTGCFPIASWGRIDWDKVHNKIGLTSDDIFTIPAVLSYHSFDISVPVYLLADEYNTPVVKTSLFTILEKVEDVMCMSPDQWIFSPHLKYVIEFCHDGEITIGWI